MELVLPEVVEEEQVADAVEAAVQEAVVVAWVVSVWDLEEIVYAHPVVLKLPIAWELHVQR